MVLAIKVGKARPFWRGFLLSVATLGLYGRYWDYRAHDEVYRQFELAREGRDEGVAWYVLAYPLPVLRFVYYHHFVSNVRYLRARMGYERSLAPGAFLGLVIPAAALLLIFMLSGFGTIASGLAEDRWGRLRVVDEEAVGRGFTLIVVGLVVWTTLRAIAYGLLQRDVNGVWQVYDARAAALRAPARPPAPVAAVAPPAAFPRPRPALAPRAPRQAPRAPPP